MSEARIRENTYVANARSVEVACFLVSLHGFLLVLAWHAPFGTHLPLALAGWLVGLLPFGIYVRRPGTPKREAILGLGILPATWLVVTAVFVAVAEAETGVLDALRIAVGLVAHLGAASERSRLHETRRAVTPSEHVRSSPEATARRHAVRTTILGLLLLALSLAIVVPPFMVEGATRYERTFAAVAGSVLVTSMLLTILPPLMRREKRPQTPLRKRVTTAALAMLLAALALGLERISR